MRRTIKKYQTPPGTLPSILEADIPTQEDALNALLKEMDAKRKGMFNNQSYNTTDGTYHLGEIQGSSVTANSGAPNTSLLTQAANQAALSDMMQKQNAASEEAFSKSVDAYRDKQVEDGSKKHSDLFGSFGSLFDKGAKGSGEGLNLSAISGVSNTVGKLTDIATSFVDVDENSSFKQQQMVGDMLMRTGNPIAAAVGAGFKGLSIMDQALGINVNTINKKEAEFADISKGERFLNNALGFLPGTGAGLLAGKTAEFDYDERLNTLGSSYGNSLNDMRTAEGMSGGRYLFGKKKINDKIRDMEEDQSVLLDAQKTNTLRMNSDYQHNLAQQNLNRYAGNNYTMTALGKDGMKLLSKEEVRSLIESRKQIKEDIAVFKDGGKMNILPEGKLHAHNHHLEDVDERLEDLTKKGIPIVSVSEDGTLSQVAEVEKEELILHLELTQQIEDLWERYKNAETAEEKNRIAFECGDLLCKEIITNTEDNTNLLKEL